MVSSISAMAARISFAAHVGPFTPLVDCLVSILPTACDAAPEKHESRPRGSGFATSSAGATYGRLIRPCGPVPPGTPLASTRRADDGSRSAGQLQHGDRESRDLGERDGRDAVGVSERAGRERADVRTEGRTDDAVLAALAKLTNERTSDGTARNDA